MAQLRDDMRSKGTAEKSKAKAWRSEDMQSKGMAKATQSYELLSNGKMNFKKTEVTK